MRSLIMPNKLTIQSMQQLGERRGGRCLSDMYVGAGSKLLWQCGKGHQWMATPHNIQRGKWCPYCIGRGKTILDMHELAAQHEGQCLSDTYVNRKTPLLWRCAKGHQWMATPADVGRGTWCTQCSGHVKLTIQEMHTMAESRGGKCLSDVYVNNQTPLLWECKEGHRWKATAGCVKRGTWCRVCAGLSKPSMDDVQRLAGERGGKLLSQNYRNARTRLEWECLEGHRWTATWDQIQRGRWCPECSAGLGERICREFFNQLFQRSFPKARPKWLINKAGNQMELDGYCPALGIAFEHQGEHHYSTKGYFLHSEADLSRRQEDDALKTTLCTQKGIALIAVPEILNRLALDQVKPFIKEQLTAKGLPLPRDFDTRPVDVGGAYATPSARQILNYLQAVAIDHGGKCLSKHYTNNHTKLLWECSKGHRWEADSAHIIRGHWCPYCAGRGKTIHDMQQLAAQKGGQCLSDTYVSSQLTLLWQCAEGHQWRALPNAIRQGHWCPVCEGNARLTIQEMHGLAESRGGKCLSDTYVNAHSKLAWQCAKGHQWMANPHDIQQGKWCPYCAGRGKTIEDMRNLAAQHAGQCLSEVYKTSKTRLLWQCQAGHRWEATPGHVLRGSWCPYCAGQGKKTIEDMKNLAVQHGGQCLSEVYRNVSTKLLWQCQAGHKWETTPDHVQRGSWCPVCFNERRGQQRHATPQRDKT